MANNKSKLKQSILFSAITLEIVTSVNAATIIVDNSTCILPDAITAANQDSATNGCNAGKGADIIQLPANSNITLTQALPAIVNDVTIEANGSSIARDDQAANFSVFQVGADAYIGNRPTLTMNSAFISGGYRSNNEGGGISALQSSLILNDSIITNNTGGGITIINGDSSEINNSEISSNVSSSGTYYYCGGLSVSGGELVITNSTISDNTTTIGSGGGGLYASNYLNDLTLNITNSTISGNSTAFKGGGIFHYDFLQLNNSTVSITNSTIVNNQSDQNGGGFSNDQADVTITQSIISGNTATTGSNEIDNYSSSFTLNNYNIIGLNNSSGSSGVIPGGSDIIPTETNLNQIIDTNLSVLGSLTPFHNLLINSPAVDAVPINNCVNSNDQIGQTRGNDGNSDMTAGCDIGAIEFTIDLIFKNGFN